MKNILVKQNEYCFSVTKKKYYDKKMYCSLKKKAIEHGKKHKNIKFGVQ